MSREKRKNITVYFRIDTDIYKEVENVRQKLGQTRSKFMADAVKKHLADVKREGLVEKVFKVREVLEENNED